MKIIEVVTCSPWRSIDDKAEKVLREFGAACNDSWLVRLLQWNSQRVTYILLFAFLLFKFATQQAKSKKKCYWRAIYPHSTTTSSSISGYVGKCKKGQRNETIKQHWTGASERRWVILVVISAPSTIFKLRHTCLSMMLLDMYILQTHGTTPA